MKSSSAESQGAMSEPSEKPTDWPEHLDLEIPKDEAKIELDEEDQNDLNAQAWYVLGKVSELRMSKRLHQEVVDLHKRFEEVLGWYKRN